MVRHKKSICEGNRRVKGLNATSVPLLCALLLALSPDAAAGREIQTVAVLPLNVKT